jgi:hypothetical protein
MRMVFNKNIGVKSLTNRGICVYGDRGFGKMITKPDKNVLSYTYKISNPIYLMITIIVSKIFVDKSVDKTYLK